MTPELLAAADYETRFGGIARLYGIEGLRRLRNSHVCVIGIGGVGSWAAEALARSGLGKLTLVDLDEVCVSNMNRQLHALDATVGRAKVEVMLERLKGINPKCDVQAVAEFFTESTAEGILSSNFDHVIDAIDNVRNKCLLIAACRERSVPIITCGAAGGKRDATGIQISDLAFSSHDRLLQKVREQLRKEHGFPRGDTPFGVECVFSREAPVLPHTEGTTCSDHPESRAVTLDEAPRLNCDWGLGSATFVTGTFGFVAAGAVIQRLAQAK